jgi:putative oxidoreductase
MAEEGRQTMPRSHAPAATVLIRLVVGGVFFSEGVQKFLYPDTLGVGRFARIGIPAPSFTGPFVGVVEVVFGLAVMVGLLTRLATVPLLIDISVALLSTKLPILLGHGVLIFSAPHTAHTGVWAALHEARTDLSMFFGLAFLLAVGAGPWSLDELLSRGGPG